MQFDNYTVERELGRGAMGVVYLARDEQLGRHVAIKTVQLAGQFSQGEHASLRARLFREAKAAARLSHPHIVTIYQVGEAAGVPYLAMEFVDGMTLEAATAPGSGWRAEPLLAGLQQVAEGLDYAHSQGLVHRDVKPANILIRRDGSFKVADFGIVKLLDETARTETNGMMGTPSYLSPEQVRGEGVSGRSDQYALAVTAFRILTERLPFWGDSVAAMFYQILHLEPGDEQLAPGLARVLRRGMAKRPAERYGTCREFVAALDGALRGEAVAAPPGERRWNPLWAAGVIGLVLIGGAGMGALVWKKRPAEPVIPERPEYFTQKQDPQRIVQEARRSVIDVLEKAKQAEPPKVAEAATFPVDLAPAGSAQRGAKDGLPYVWIPAGSFPMGCSAGEMCSSDEVRHTVRFQKGFWLGATEVTAGAFRRYVKEKGAKMPEAGTGRDGWKDERMPISYVNHRNAAAFCAWSGGRLPTEAEWEYAARAGTRGLVYGPLEKVAWIYQDDLLVYTKAHDGNYPPVGTKAPNRFGLFDMIGGLNEWVSDFYDADYYKLSPAVDPTGPVRGDGYVHRGGSLLTIPNDAGASRRRWALAETEAPDIGFRCVGGMSGL